MTIEKGLQDFTSLSPLLDDDQDKMDAGLCVKTRSPALVCGEPCNLTEAFLCVHNSNLPDSNKQLQHSG
jgi:hypothetical protein